MQYVFGYASVSLKDVCSSIKDGMHNLPFTSDNGKHPILSAANVFDNRIDYSAKRYVDSHIFEKERKRTNIELGDVLLTIVATIGRSAVVDKKYDFLLQRSVCALKPNRLIDSKYLKFVLDTGEVQNYMKKNAHGSAQAGLYLNQVEEIRFNLPKIEEQKKIVSLLDKFDSYCNDIANGLPGEIEARQKQYEYYRDKLLNMKRLEV